MIGLFPEEKTVTYYIEAIDTLSQKTISDTYSFTVTKSEYSNGHGFRIKSLDFYPYFKPGDNITLFVEVKNYGLRDQAHVRVVYPNEGFGLSNEIIQTRFMDNNQSGLFAFEFTLNHNNNVTATVYVSDVFYNTAISENITFVVEDSLQDNNNDNISNGSTNDKNEGETPGFELIFVIISLIMILIWKKRYE
jgi:hypothetical protein